MHGDPVAGIGPHELHAGDIRQVAALLIVVAHPHRQLLQVLDHGTTETAFQVGLQLVGYIHQAQARQVRQILVGIEPELGLAARN